MRTPFLLAGVGLLVAITAAVALPADESVGLETSTEANRLMEIDAGRGEADPKLSAGDLKREIRDVVPNPAEDEVSSAVVRLFPNYYLSDEATTRERKEVAVAAVDDLATCYSSTHKLSDEEAHAWAGYVFDSTYSGDDGTSFISGRKDLSQAGLVDLGVAFPDSGSIAGPKPSNPDPKLDPDGKPLELIPFPEGDVPTEYDSVRPGSPESSDPSAERDFSQAYTWGPCVEGLGKYLTGLTFGRVAADLEARDVSLALTAEETADVTRALEICPNGDEGGCDKMAEMIEALYPVHEKIARRLIDEGQL